LTQVTAQPLLDLAARRREALRRAYAIILSWPKSEPDRQDEGEVAAADAGADGKPAQAEELQS